jgi:hypothetical protein
MTDTLYDIKEDCQTLEVPQAEPSSTPVDAIDQAVASLSCAERRIYDQFIERGYLVTDALEMAASGEFLPADGEASDTVNVTIFGQAVHYAMQRRDVAAERLICSRAAARIRADIRKREQKIAQEIASEVDAAGKKIYSNADSRNAELTKRVEGDEQLSGLLIKARDLEEKADCCTVHERYYGDLVGIYRAFAPSLIAAEQPEA